MISTITPSGMSYTPVNKAGDTMTGALYLPSGGLNVGSGQLVVDSGGRVLMPNQPYCRSSSNTNVSNGGRIPLNTYSSIRGGISLESSGRITVPATGAYVVGYSHLSMHPNGQLGIQINGVFQGGTRSQGLNIGGDYYCLASQTILNLSANDYIEFWVTSGQIHGNADYNAMWLFLLG